MDMWHMLCMQSHDYFCMNYPIIAIYSGLGFLGTSYLHYQWKVHNSDLIYWRHMVEAFSENVDYFQLAMLLVIFAINTIFVSIILTFYLRPPIEEDGEMSLLEIKDRYSRFILLTLISRLDRIQSKLSAKRKSLTLQHLARAHTNMVKAVALFRKDARKLILPNESEIMMPIEDIYGVPEDKERMLRRGGYYDLTIDITDETVKGLFNAT